MALSRLAVRSSTSCSRSLWYLRFSRTSRRCVRARCTSVMNSSIFKGLMRYPKTPMAMASRALSRSGYAVISSTGRSGSRSSNCRASDRPSIPDIRQSVTTRSTGSRVTFSRACSPEGAAAATYPVRSIHWQIVRRTASLSSTIKIEVGILFLADRNIRHDMKKLEVSQAGRTECKDARLGSTSGREKRDSQGADIS